MKPRQFGPVIFWASFPLAALVAVASGAGLFWPQTYAQERPLWAAEGMGGDAVNLALVVPVLLASAIFARRGSLTARTAWMGTLFYLIYNFLIYTFAVHFNALFLVYCGALGLGALALAGSLPALPSEEIAEAYGPGAPVRLVAVLFFLFATLVAVGWLREDIPALLSGQTPQSIREVGLFTNPPHVLDLSLLLPGLFITAIMLLRRRPLAFVLAPALMTFLALMSAQLAGLVVALIWKGFAAGYTMAFAFLALGAGFGALQAVFCRRRTRPVRATPNREYPTAA